MVAKVEKNGGQEAAAAASAASNHHPRRRKTFSRPSWLLCAIADMDERIKMLTRKISKDNNSHSFGERANSYYHERPQLLALLQDLYNGYLSLADRYCQALAKNNPNNHPRSRCSSPVPFPKFEDATHPDDGEVVDSDAESSVSFQPPSGALVRGKDADMDKDMFVVDLVMKTVECEILASELAVMEKRWGESSRKIELQKNLLDVLESERLILLNDNATLGYRVSALVEENQGLVSESLFLKRKAAELARCMLKARDDHRVCVLSRKIEDLQGQIYRLEKRNKEYYDKLVKQEEKNKGKKGFFGHGGDREEVSLEDCLSTPAGFGKCFTFNSKTVVVEEKNENGKGSKLWERVKKFDLFLCSPNMKSAGF